MQLPDSLLTLLTVVKNIKGSSQIPRRIQRRLSKINYQFVVGATAT